LKFDGCRYIVLNSSKQQDILERLAASIYIYMDQFIIIKIPTKEREREREREARMLDARKWKDIKIGVGNEA
jgi:hypothetical protein